MHPLRGPDALPAAGTRHLAGAGRPSSGRSGPALSSGPACPPHGELTLTVHLDILPALGEDKGNQIVGGLRDAPPDALVVADLQVTGLRGVPEAAVVVRPAPAGVLHASLQVEQVDHFMKESSGNVLNGPIQRPRSDVQLVSRASVRSLPRLCHGDMSVGPGRVLDGDDGLLDDAVEVSLVQGPENLLQVPGGPAGLYGLLHGAYLPKSKVFRPAEIGGGDFG